MSLTTILQYLKQASNDELFKIASMAASQIKVKNFKVKKEESQIKKVETEVLGKEFEMGICLALNTEYNGKYNYSMEDAEKYKIRLSKLKDICPPLTHTAEKGARYDFTGKDDKEFHLSAKTTKKDGKIAPQCIGQASPETLCKRLNIPIMSQKELKKYLQENIKTLLYNFNEYTFSCPIVYYNKSKDKCLYLEVANEIKWEEYEYSWTKPWDNWNNSSTLKININGKDIPIMEFQFHSKSRSNTAIRWYMESMLTHFGDNLKITEL